MAAKGDACMKFAPPSSLGPFSVDPLGRIAPRSGGELPRFSFQWRARRLTAELLRTDTDGSLTISAWLGRVPSSAGPDDAGRRINSFATLRGLLDTLPSDWRVRLTPDHQVSLEAAITLTWPASAVALMAEITGFLLALAPYLDVLDEAAVLEPPHPAAG
jgi:hypothetical protein